MNIVSRWIERYDFMKFKNVFVAFIIILPLTFGALNAGTVSLTGTCSHSLGNNTVLFSLENSGNDSAYNVHVLPSIEGEGQRTYNLGTLEPKGYLYTYVNITNISAMGTYADYFTVAYQQDTQSFVAVFPCLFCLFSHSDKL